MRTGGARLWKDLRTTRLPFACDAAPDRMLGSVWTFRGPSAGCVAKEPSGTAGFTSSSGLGGIRGMVDDWM